MRGLLSRRVLISIGAVTFLAGVLMVAVGLISSLSADDGNAASVNQLPTASPTNTPRVTPAPTPTLSPTETDTPSPNPAPTPPLGDKPFRMVIESIGVDGPVQTFGLDENAIPEVPTEANSSDPGALIAWYDFSAEPGMGSNAVFAGHNTWYGDAVFIKLWEVQIGDTIKLRADDGTELVYAVSDNFTVDPDDPTSLQVMKPTPTDLITLITCGGTFIDTGDPVFGGEYTDRVIVQADLVSITTVGALSAPVSSG